MNIASSIKHVGYIVKMFPRLSETFILNEILELERQGVAVSIFSARKPNEGRFHPQLSELKAQVFYLDGLDPKKWPQWLGPHWSHLEPRKQVFFDLLERGVKAQDPVLVERVCQAASIAAGGSRLNIDHWHAHFATLPSTLAWFASQLSGKPFSFTAHAKDIYVYQSDEHFLSEKMAAADRVVTVTEFNRRHLLDTYSDLGTDRLEMLHNGIDLSHFCPATKAREGTPEVLTVGRLVEKKGFSDLLEAMAILQADGVAATCRIIGQGPEEENLRDQARRLGLDRVVTFAGALHRDEVLQAMRAATVICLPCVVATDGNQDALPTVLLEALGCGLPAVSTHVSGIPEIIESGTSGELVSPNDPNQLAAALRRVITQPKLRTEYALAGRKKAEQAFDLSKNVQTLRSIFAACAHQSSETTRNSTLTNIEDVHAS